MKAKKALNDNSFEYISKNGTKFLCTRCDFTDIVLVEKYSMTKREDFMSDIAEMAGYHAVNIRPDLNGFAGYDCIRFELKVVRDNED